MKPAESPYIAVYQNDQGYCYSVVSSNHSMMWSHYATPQELKEKLRFIPRNIFSCASLEIRNIVPPDALLGQHPRELELADLEKILKYE